MAQRNRRRMMPSPLHPVSAETAQLDNAPVAAAWGTIRLWADTAVSNGIELGPRIGIQSEPLSGVGTGLSR
jgi:hypothetical protein